MMVLCKPLRTQLRGSLTKSHGRRKRQGGLLTHLSINVQPTGQNECHGNRL